ncbi:hypothetical protein [Paraburkholderia sp. BL23I1N1]|uniref:hypothetical protein n=1 Tax=Paraburkholderia sp. BL23I1N1 TaxID=1938802 RepID=UPI0015FF119A|nr:hypothetical protein [Paraburkholderia sp. BL23I1N1]
MFTTQLWTEEVKATIDYEVTNPLNFDKLHYALLLAIVRLWPGGVRSMMAARECRRSFL